MERQPGIQPGLGCFLSKAKRCFLYTAALALSSFAASGQNATVTANVKLLSGGAALPTGNSVRVDLQNCTSPRVPGSGNIVSKSQTFYPNTSGVANITLFSNSVIDCGAGVLTNPVSFYTFNLVANGQVTSLGSYKVPVGSTTLDTLTPINTTPVINTPTGDNTYLRLDLGNFGNLAGPFPDVVYQDNAQTISGQKTFTQGPLLSDGFNAVTQTYLQSYVNGQLGMQPASFIPGTASSSLAFTANQNIAANSTALFTDGTQAYSAGPVYAPLGTFIDDTTLAAMHNPKAFPAANLLNIVNKFIAARNASGDFPLAVGLNGTSSGYYSAWDLHQAHATGDGWIMVPQMLYLYCQDVGTTSSACTSAYTADIAAIKTAMARPPRNGSTGLITVNPGDEYVAGMAFMEYMRNTGDVANANVWYAIVCQKLAVLATAAGDTTNASFFNAQYATTVAGIQANLIDGTTGMLKAATIQNSSNLDVVSSVLADYYGLLTTAQNTAIETYLSSHYATLVNADGYVLETPGGWATIGYIPSGGGPPYGAAGFTNTQYQGGYWSFFEGEFAALLAKRSTAPGSPGQVATLLTAFVNGADPNTEYYNVGSTVPNGTSPNLESPQGALWAALNYPQLVNTQTIAVPNQVTYSGGGNNLIQNYSSSSSANTANTYTNTSGAGYSAAEAIGGSANTLPGAMCYLIINQAGVAINHQPLCFGGVSASAGYTRMGVGDVLQWTSATPSSGGVLAGFSVIPGTNSLSLDDGGAGDSKGNLLLSTIGTRNLGFTGTTFTLSGSGTTPIGGATAGTFHCPSAGVCTTTVTVGAGTPGPTHGWLTLELRDDSTPANVCQSTARGGLTVTFTCTTTAANEIIEFALANY
jgi:hypothetical protein